MNFSRSLAMLAATFMLPSALSAAESATAVRVIDWDAAPDPGLVYTPRPSASARVGIALPVGKCINMGNQLDAPKEGDWAPAIADDDFKIIKAAGFTTVRLPVAWSAHAQESSPYRIDPAFMARVHKVIHLATAARLNVILNVHHYQELNEAPAANTQRFVALWRQIASSFSRAGPNVWFELKNEPHDKLTNVNLMSVFGPALRAVRASNPTRPVLIGGGSWSNVDSLATLPLPSDPYVVPTFHYYEPYDFTQQGAAWLPDAPPFGRAYGSSADKALLDRALKKVEAYMARTGRVPVLGEYGVEDDPRLPLGQRVRYYHAVSSAFASIGLGSCAWGYRVSRLRDGDHWLPGMVEAISAPVRR